LAGNRGATVIAGGRTQASAAWIRALGRKRHPERATRLSIGLRHVVRFYLSASVLQHGDGEEHPMVEDVTACNRACSRSADHREPWEALQALQHRLEQTFLALGDEYLDQPPPIPQIVRGAEGIERGEIAAVMGEMLHRRSTECASNGLYRGVALLSRIQTRHGKIHFSQPCSTALCR
jgi:hypothetical protein